jgi:hypothetical protein
MTKSNHDGSRSLLSMAGLDSERRPERILIVGGGEVPAPVTEHRLVFGR